MASMKTNNWGKIFWAREVRVTLTCMTQRLTNEPESIESILRSLDQKTGELLVQHAETARRLVDIERKQQEFLHFREKFLDWLSLYSKKLEDVRVQNKESRVSFESVFCRIEDLDQDVRLLKAAVRDVDRRYESLRPKIPPEAAPFQEAPQQRSK